MKCSIYYFYELYNGIKNHKKNTIKKEKIIEFDYGILVNEKEN